MCLPLRWWCYVSWTRFPRRSSVSQFGWIPMARIRPLLFRIGSFPRLKINVSEGVAIGRCSQNVLLAWTKICVWGGNTEVVNSLVERASKAARDKNACAADSCGHISSRYSFVVLKFGVCYNGIHSVNCQEIRYWTHSTCWHEFLDIGVSWLYLCFCSRRFNLQRDCF